MEKNKSKNSQSTLFVIEKKLDFITKNPILSLAIIGIIGLIIRLYYVSFDLPLELDGLSYFWYAIDMSILGWFPTNPDYNFPNNGWPSFLSIFFFLIHSNNFLDYMNIQRILTITISVLTIIPIYLLSTRFFEKSYALFVSALFVFEPKIIQNSLAGITEPSFILLGVTALFLFLSKKNYAVYASFGVVTLFSLVRYEGLLLIIPFSIMFFVRFRKQRNVVLKYAIAVSIFILILLPMVYIRIENTGNDGLISYVLVGPRYYQNVSQESGDPSLKIFEFITTGFHNLIKFFGWAMIPFFIFFIPFGIVSILKNRDDKKHTIILVSITMLLPAFYAYSRGIPDTRYLLVLYPIFSVLSIFTLEKIDRIIKKQNIFLVLLIVGILFLSLSMTKFDNFDHEKEKNIFEIAMYVEKTDKRVNEWITGGKYFATTKLIGVEKFPIMYSTYQLKDYDSKIVKIPINEFDSLTDYIDRAKELGLTDILVDENKQNPDFLNDVFLNEKKYPYLIKDFDSIEYGYSYEVKIFRIDYDQYKKTQQKP